jgi:hypothetical protein
LPAVELGFQPGGKNFHLSKPQEMFVSLQQLRVSSGRRDAALYGRRDALPLQRFGIRASFGLRISDFGILFQPIFHGGR